ncbi:unnamed protein product, partial [marine sediment metagenome]
VDLVAALIEEVKCQSDRKIIGVKKAEKGSRLLYGFSTG